MLSQLLSSRPKTQLINLFLAHAQRSFSFTELKVNAKCPPKILKQALRELEKIEFLNLTARNKIKYYQMNRHFALYPELVNLLRKVKNIPQDSLAVKACRFNNLRMIAFTGLLVGKPRLETDILFVGKINAKRLSGFLALAEKLVEQEINFTIFSLKEFEYRLIMNDRFVKNIMDNNPLLVIDRIKHKNISKVSYKL